MASSIKGITVEIGGDTNNLVKSLEGVNKNIRNTQSQLKDVERLLKLDPTNTELLTQKQKLLKAAVSDTKDKLQALKTASEAAAKTADNYGAWKTKYDAIQSEIETTTTELKKLKKQAENAEKQLADGKISQEKYDALQSKIKSTETKLKDLKEAAKQVDDEFGHPISPEQYDALQREIQQTENDLKKLEQQAGESRTALVKLSETGKKFQDVGDKISGVGTKLLPVSTGIAAIGTLAVKTGAEFDSAMSNVASISGATGSEIDALRDKAREMGSKTKFSASEAADAMSYMAMAGWKTSDMLNGIEGIMNLAAASGEDLATTSDIVTDALTAFGLKAEDSGHFADILAAASSNANTNVSMMGETFKYAAPVLGSLGYSAEDSAIAIGLMANAGIKSSQAGTALRGAIVSLAKPTDTVSAAMEQYGISLTDSSGKMYSLRDLMGQMRDKLGGLTEAEQAQAAASLFGREAMSGMLAIINASPADFEKLTNAVDTCPIR